jgi:hypothetical protein
VISVKKLSAASFSKARDWIYEYARPLDRIFWGFYFESKSRDRVVHELSFFQNKDGGFRLLEIDVRTPLSSPICTAIAFHYFIELKIPSEHPLVKGAVEYFSQTLDSESLRWHAVPVESNESPHAPWWTCDPKTGVAGPETAFNPTAEILGALVYYGKAFPEELRRLALEKISAEILSSTANFGSYDLLSCMKLLPHLTETSRKLLEPKILSEISKLVSRDSASWSGHGLKPWWIAPTPSSLGADLLTQDTAANLDWEIDQQHVEGFWAPTWNWYDGSYPETWPVAEREWRGFLTLKTVKALRDYDRL